MDAITPTLAGWLLVALGGYGVLGTVFAVAFVLWGAQATDPASQGMPITARLFILPGAASLWPLLLLRWLRRQPPPVA